MKALRKRLAPPELLPRPELLEVPSAVHGGIDVQELERLGLDANQVIDFSVNTNPFGPAPPVREILTKVALGQYPDPESRVLRTALADRLELAPEQILPGNGASELIWLIALSFLKRGSRVLIVGPTYSEYARAAALMGASVTTLLTHQDDDFTIHPDQVLRSLRRSRPHLFFVCNPNNPTGTFLEPAEISFWARQHSGTLFVVDEAYIGFSVDFLNAERKLESDNVILLRSMTKDLGLPALRLGYALGSQEVVGWLARARPPWNVNGLAQAAGVEALRHVDYYRDSLKSVTRAKTELVRGLTKLGYKPAPSTMPFFLLPVGDGAAFRQSLLKKGLLVRDGASFGLPGHVRISTRRPEENARLLSVLAEVPHAR